MGKKSKTGNGPSGSSSRKRGRMSTNSALQSVNDAHSSFGELHPLYNDSMLTNIFKYVPNEQIPTCRLVCRTWRDLTLSTWRSSRTLRIWNGEAEGTYLAGGTSISEFVQLWERECSTEPYRQFHLSYWALGESAARRMEPDSERFWKLVGPHMSKLTLEDCSSIQAESFFKIIHQHCPNLESLKLESCTFRSPPEWESYKNLDDRPRRLVGHPNLKSLHLCRYDEELRISYIELLANFPHLSYIYLDAGNPGDEVRSVLMSVGYLRRQQGLENSFPHLQLGTVHPVGLPLGRGYTERVGGCILNQLRSCRVGLQSACLYAESCADKIKEVIELTGGTLTTLIVPREGRCRFPFGVQMDHLRVLAMSEKFCESLEFIKYTPNLEKLFIDGGHFGRILLPERLPRGTGLVANSPKLALANVRLRKLTTFKIQSVVSEDDLNWLVKWFPNLRELEMFLDNRQFQIVCENWKNLVKLEVYGDELTDEGLTGFKFAPRALRSGRVPAVAGEVPNANIASLTNLKEFSFIGARLTEASVFHGFLKSGSLRKIVFGTQFRTSMLGEGAIAELAGRNMEISDFSLCKYHHYDLSVAKAFGEVRGYWDQLKCQNQSYF